MTPSDFSGAWTQFSRTQAARQAEASPAATAPEAPDASNAASAPQTAPQEDAAAHGEAAVSAAAPLRRSPGSKAPAGAPSTADPGMPPSFAQRCFTVCSCAAFLFLPLLLAAQFRLVYPGLTPWLLPQEAGFAGSYELAKAAGEWLVPSASSPPLWFWFLRLTDTLPFVDGPLVYTAAAFGAGLLTLLASWFLALSLGWSRHTAFAGGLVLLSCLYFPPAAHRVGPELLSAGLIVLASACLFRGWSRERSFLWLGLGGLFSGAAGLSGGFFGLLLPLLSSFIFLAAQGKFRRLNKPDGALGFGLLLLPPLLWLGAAILFSGENAPLTDLGARLTAPLLPPYWPPKDPVWFYLLLLPAALFPWIFALPFALRRGPKSLRATAAARAQRAGSAWIWLNLAIGLFLLSAASAKPCLGVLPLVPLLALALGKTLTELAPSGSRAFFLSIAGFFLLGAIVLGFVALLQAWPALIETLRLPRPELFAALRGLPLPALVCLVSALLLWKIPDKRFPGACLLISALCVTALCQTMLLHATPAMQDVLAGPAVRRSVPEQTAPAETGTQTSEPAPQPEQAAPEAPEETPSAPPQAQPSPAAAPAQPEQTAPTGAQDPAHSNGGTEKEPAPEDAAPPEKTDAPSEAGAKQE